MPGILECRHCEHGWHALACEGITRAAGGIGRCPCPNSAPQVPTVAQFLAGARNPDAGIVQ